MREGRAVARWTGMAEREADKDADWLANGAVARGDGQTGLLRRMQGEEDGMKQGCRLLRGKRARGCCAGRASIGGEA